MKKKLSFLLASLLCFGALAGCNKRPNSGFSGTYWLESHSATTVQKGFYEKIEYDVSFMEPDGDFAPVLHEMTEGYLNFTVDGEKSKYVAELYEEGGLYVYHTKLEIYGEYTFGEATYKVDGDITESITKFKGMDDNFACVEAVKKIKNVYPTIQTPLNADDFVTVTAEFKTVYDGKKATLTVDAKDDVSKGVLSSVQEPTTIKKYNKKAYIDNELMLLLFRNFSYDNSLSYTFRTLETTTGTLKEIIGQARLTQATTEANSNEAIRSFPLESYIDNLGGRIPRKFSCFGVTFKTTGEYSQDFAYAYYANKIEEEGIVQNDTRHYLIKCFRPAIYNIGYFVYTLDSVTHER